MIAIRENTKTTWRLDFLVSKKFTKKKITSEICSKKLISNKKKVMLDAASMI